MDRVERESVSSSRAISGHQWPSRAISGHQWPSRAISGHQWPSVAISGHQWPSVAISGHQMQSPERPKMDRVERERSFHIVERVEVTPL